MKRPHAFFVLIALLWTMLTTSVNAGDAKMVVFGDSLSDTGNTTKLLKSLRQEEDPAFLVRPFKVFVLQKMNDFADRYHVPQMVLDQGVSIVEDFFDHQLAPMLVDLVAKVKRVPVLPGAPYWQNRFTNGRVWSEYLAPMMGIDREDVAFFDNQAFAGSWTVTYDYQLTVWNLIRHPINTLKFLVVGKLIPPSLGLVTQTFMLEHPVVDANATYFILSGGNDYLNMLLFEDNYNPAVMRSYVDNVLSALKTAMRRMISHGARKIVVIGLPNIGQSPKFANTMDNEVLKKAIDWHNAGVQVRMADLKKANPQVSFEYVDLQPIFEDILTRPGYYGFSVTDKPCIDVKLDYFDRFAASPFANNYVLRYAQVLQYKDRSFAAHETNYHVCDKPDEYVFWDEIHPATKAHRIFANALCQQLKTKGFSVQCVEDQKSVAFDG